MVLEFVPLLLAGLLVLALALESASRTVEIAVTSVSYRLFGDMETSADERRERSLRTAGIGTPYRIYAAKTHVYGTVGGFVGAVLGSYIGAGIISFLGVEGLSDRVPAGLSDLVPAGLSDLVPAGLSDLVPEVSLSLAAKQAAILGGTALALGVLSFAIVYFVRWQLPSFRADTRRRQIDASMARMVAFIYALSRGGMSIPDVMESLARNEGVFGAGAEEMAVGVRDIDLFGTDVVTAVRQTSRRTPSKNLRNFMQNLSSVLQSGRNFSEFLGDEYRRYREQAEEQQEEILELLATAAEVYVTVVVAGMLFLITILFVIGITSGDTLVLVQLITYAILPATNIIFMAYLAEITQPLKATRESGDGLEDGPSNVASDRLALEPTERSAGAVAADGGVTTEVSGASRDADNRARLNAYKRIEQFRESATSPVSALTVRPELILFVTVPLALGYVLARLPGVFDGGFDPWVLDDVLVHGTVFVLATYAVVYEISRRRLERLEGSLPDLLERLASLNEAGVSIVSSIDRVRRTDIGELDEEAERIWRDIQWGATVEQALDRFQQRVETPSVTRTVTLINNAMRASNEIAPVIRIAAEQARSDRQLKRQRRQEMFTYLVVIYVAFIVFVVVIAAIDTVLIPNLPDASSLPETNAAGFLQVSNQGTEAYRLTFFHAALVQSTLSGLVGGQMGNGSIKDGAKHAAIMLAITYAVFLLFSSFNFIG
jgi:flagellar protein FlaJ